MKIDIYQIDAFTDTLFGGNPAAVCPLDSWLDDFTLQKIAAENNLSETAFFVKLSNGKFHLRWFTPQHEMDLCGHATLATAFVIFNELDYLGDTVIFDSISGELTVDKEDDLYVLDFPSRPPKKERLPDVIEESLNIQPKEVWKSRDYLLVYEHEDDILKIEFNRSIIDKINIDPGGIIVTAKGSSSEVDFVSRFFTPQAVVFEDPVTGSAHCSLIPFWAERLGKTKLEALQLSDRKGKLSCELHQERVKIKGRAVKYLSGVIEL